MAVNQPSKSDDSRRLSEDEINLAKENLRKFRSKIRDLLAEESGRDPDEIKKEVQSAPMPDPFD